MNDCCDSLSARCVVLTGKDAYGDVLDGVETEAVCAGFLEDPLAPFTNEESAMFMGSYTGKHFISSSTSGCAWSTDQKVNFLHID